MHSTTRIRILVVCHSATGNTLQLAEAVAAGAAILPDTEVSIKLAPPVPGSPQPDARAADHPEASVGELPDYDGIAFGSPVHFGNMSAAMRSFLDQTVSLWNSRKLEGKPATVFMAAGSGAGREAAILSFWNTLALHGMILLPTGLHGTEMVDTLQPQGNTPFGASSLAAAAGERPSESELYVAHEQGRALAKLAAALRHYQQKLKNI